MKRVSLLASGIVLATFIFGVANAKPTLQKIQRMGTTSMSKASPTHTVTDPLGNEFRQGPEEEKSFLKNVTGTVKPARVPSSHVPTPAGMSVTSVAGAGFNGLTHLDQRLADGGNQFSSEPPDQCLAVGGEFVLEGVNSAFRVNSTVGAPPVGPVSMNAFFGLPVAIDRDAHPTKYGPFTSDPKCLYDASSGHWFITMLVIDTDPSTGDFLPTASVRIAVSTTSNPTGTYNLFVLDTTNATGTPEHAGCPCFGDQPLIGADANGFYITTNEFPIFVPGFNGAQIYAMSKSMLIANLPLLAVMFSGPPLAEGISYSVQPAMVPPGALFEESNGGTQYFLSALEFSGGLDNRIAMWAMINTSSLNDTVPSVVLRSPVVLDSQVYGQPPAAQQKDGPLPLARRIESGVYGKAGKQHLPLLESNDDRMQQTVFAAGKLWSSLTTVIKTENGPVRSGAAWFAVTPSWIDGQLGGVVSAQGIVAVNNRSILFPAVGVNKAGFAVMGFTLVGTDMFPSAAYAVLGGSTVNIVAAGVAPDDGLTGYPIFTGANTGRWGDYSAAATDEHGNIWFATEYIPAGPRTALANWGTFIAKVAPVVAPSP